MASFPEEKKRKLEASTPVGTTVGHGQQQEAEKSKKKKACSKDRSVSVESEVRSLLGTVRLHKSEMRCRQDVKRRVLRVASEVWSGVGLEGFGSHGTALEWFGSDLDLRATGVLQAPADACLDLKTALARTPWARDVEARPRARVPIVCFVDGETGVAVDVSFGSDTDTDLDTARGDWFAGASPIFYDLVLVMKLYLAEKHLDKPFYGGLGSFRLAVLVKHFLAEAERDGPIPDLGAALVALFRFVLHDFDFYRRVLRITVPAAASSSSSSASSSSDANDVFEGRESVRPRSLDVAYGNVDVPPLRRACLAALDVLDRALDGPLLPRLFGPHALALLLDARRTNLDKSRAFAKRRLKTAAIPPPPTLYCTTVST